MNQQDRGGGERHIHTHAPSETPLFGTQSDLFLSPLGILDPTPTRPQQHMANAYPLHAIYLSTNPDL